VDCIWKSNRGKNCLDILNYLIKKHLIQNIIPRHFQILRRGIKIPKEGFTTLTIGDIVYDKWHDFHQTRKKNLSVIGIGSLSGLISLILDCVSKQDGKKLTEIIQMEEDNHG